MLTLPPKNPPEKSKVTLFVKEAKNKKKTKQTNKQTHTLVKTMN